MIDANAYRQMMADPSCTLEDAIMAYARDNIDVARQMTNANATVSEPLDYQELMNYLSDLDPITILDMGHGSPQFKSDSYWFRISWDDEIIPLTDDEADEWFLDNFHEAVVPLILAGSIPLPDDLQRIVSLWNHRGFSTSNYDLPPYRGGRGGSKTLPKDRVKPKSKFDKARSAGKKPAPKKPVQKSSNKRPSAGTAKKAVAKPRSSGTASRKARR